MILMLPRNASCNICVLGVFFCSDHMTSKFGCVYKRSEWICNATVPVCNSPCQLTSVQPLICPIITKSQFVLSNELSSNQVLLSSQFYHWLYLFTYPSAFHTALLFYCDVIPTKINGMQCKQKRWHLNCHF